MTRSGTAVFRSRLGVLKEILSFWIQDKEIFIGEHVHQEAEDQEDKEVDTDMRSAHDEIPSVSHQEMDDVMVQERSPENSADARPDEDQPVTVEFTGEHEDFEDNLEGVSFAAKPRKRGRPKGSCTTAIGLPRRKKQKLTGKANPFHKKDTTSRQKFLLLFFTDEEAISNAFTSKTLIEEESVEVPPENVPSAVLDSHVDIRIIQKFFSVDEWTALESVYNARKNLPWTCQKCMNCLQDDLPSIGCDSCLNWFHWECQGIKTRLKTKFWFCKDCKN